MKEEHCYCKYQPLRSEDLLINKEADIWQFLVHWAGCFISKCEEELVHDEKSNSNYFITVSAILLSACGRKEELYEIPDLSQYKTDYVGDSSNVINIVSGQEYPEGYSYDSIQIQSETKPYVLTVFLKVSRLQLRLKMNCKLMRI